MKRPETPPENLVGIQGDSIQITNMDKKLKEQMEKFNQKKTQTIIVNGKQFPQRNYNPQMAKKNSKTRASSISSYVTVDSHSDNYFLYYEFPAFPSKGLFKHKTMMPKSYFPKTVKERLPTRSEFDRIFSPKIMPKIDLMLADTAPNTPPQNNLKSSRVSPRKTRRKCRSQSSVRMSYPRDKMSFRAII